MRRSTVNEAMAGLLAAIRSVTAALNKIAAPASPSGSSTTGSAEVAPARGVELF